DRDRHGSGSPRSLLELTTFTEKMRILRRWPEMHSCLPVLGQEEMMESCCNLRNAIAHGDGSPEQLNDVLKLKQLLAWALSLNMELLKARVDALKDDA